MKSKFPEFDDILAHITDYNQWIQYWPAEGFVNFGGLDLQELYSLKDLFKNKHFCDIGFGRGNILHALYPVVKSLTGYETYHAVGNYLYESTPELLFLKGQKHVPVTLHYKFFNGHEETKSLSNIDVFYVAIGVEASKNLQLQPILELDSKVVIHRFRMTRSSFDVWTKDCDESMFNIYEPQTTDHNMRRIDRFCVGESSHAVGSNPVVATVKRISDEAGLKEHVYTLVYASKGYEPPVSWAVLSSNLSSSVDSYSLDL
jgi:hypothetical protein